MSTFHWLLAAFFAGIVLVFAIAWVAILKRPLIPNLTKYKGAVSSPAGKWVAIVVFSAIAIAILWWMFGAILMSTIENPYQWGVVTFITSYWLWLVGAVILGFLAWKDPGMAKFAIGVGLVILFVVLGAGYLRDGTMTPPKDTRIISAQTAGTTLSVGIDEPIKLYLSNMVITPNRDDKGVICDLDVTQPFALRADGTTRTGEFITMSPVAHDAAKGQLYVTITAQAHTYTKEGLQAVNIFCYDGDPQT